MNTTKSNFGKKGWGIVIYVLILYLFSAAAVDLLNVTVDAFANIKGWDPNSLLVFSSIGGWVGVVLSLLFGQWVASKGVKVPTVVGLFIFGIIFILNGQVNSIATYGLAVIGLGSVSGCINLVSTNTYMSNWFPRKKGIALGWATMGMPISSAICIPIFMGILAAAKGNIAVPFAVFGVAVVLVGIVTALIVKPTPEEAGAYPDNEEISKEQALANIETMNNYKSPWSISKLLRCRQMWLITLIFGFMFIALMATMVQFVPRFMSSGFTQPEAIMWLSVASVLGIIGSYLWGVLDQKTSTKTATIIFTLYMTAIQFLGAIFINNKVVSTIIIILIGVLIGGLGNLFPSMVIQVFGRYDFSAANRVIVPLLTAIRTSTFIIMAVILTATHGSYLILSVVLGIFSAIAFLMALMLSNKQIGTEI